VVEGRHGDVLTAVGSSKDHSIATAVLSRIQETAKQQTQQQQTQSSQHAGHTHPRFPPRSAIAAGGRATPRQFGVVYEHRDCFGKPQFIGHTGGVPEQRFAEDSTQHQGVRNLLTYQEGRSEVVWAGTSAAAASIGAGGGGGGGGTMENITQSIVEQRAQEQHLDKLRGPKPYSRHGY
jgi:hypothetical protein